MRLLLSLVLFVGGLLTLATPALPLGLLMICGGTWLFSTAGPAAEERFTAGLMLLGAIGALAVVVQFVWERILA